MTERNGMSVTELINSHSRWVFRAIGWTVSLAIIFTLGYRVMFKKQVVRAVTCLDQVASNQRPNSALASVDKYAACIAANAGNAQVPAAYTLSVRCRYAGVWSAARGSMVYQVTLEADGRFVAEPVENAPPNASSIAGAWTVAGNAMVWAYDSGAVWPPDINPISAASASEFTLAEVNGSTTRYTLIERSAVESCAKQTGR